MRRFALWGSLALAAAAMAPGRPVLADAPVEVGRSIFVVADVEGRLGDAPPKRIVVNDDIAYEEDITTGDDAKTVIEFRDGSTFEIGPGSVVRVDSFVFNPDEGVSRKAMSVGRGVFRYISGYAAPQQDTTISTANGTLAIRGSVASGIVEPEVPIFLYVGEGSAVFTNDTGSAELRPGNALAVPSRTTPIMRPAAMPPAVVAQALQAIDRRLPPAAILRRRPPAGAAWLRRAGSANLLPVADQARRAAAAGRPLAGPAGPSRLAREVSLLSDGNRRNLFDGAHPDRTPEQQAFIAAADRTMPQARAQIARATAQSAVLHRSANLEGAQTVIRGAAAAAPSPDAFARTAATAARANPAAAPQIGRTAVAAYRGPDRARVAAQLGKTQAGESGARRPRRGGPAPEPGDRRAVRQSQPRPPAAQPAAAAPRPGKPPPAAETRHRNGKPRQEAAPPQGSPSGPPRQARPPRNEQRKHRPDDQPPR